MEFGSSPSGGQGNEELRLATEAAARAMHRGESAVLELLESAAGDDTRALRAVLRIAHAALATQRVEDAIEVVAEESLLALDAASLSISRWERESGMLRTLINVGELGPGEERWPADEEYPLAEYRRVTDLLRRGEPYLTSIDDPDADPAAVRLLRALNKESQLAVPVIYEDSMWGDLWATGTGGRRFGPRDVKVLQAIAGQVSMAIGRAELFTRVSRFAYEDPLTRLANRRRLDERLRGLDTRDSVATLLICDVDGLKEVNDRDGHPAGDALLRGIAGALSSVASASPGSLVARLGGDEFCVLLPGQPLSAAEHFAREASRQIATELGERASLCWGAASSPPTAGAPHELIAAADSALLEAKGLGPGRLRLRLAGEPELPEGPVRRRSSTFHGRRAADDLVPRFVALLDERRPRDTLAALELLAYELGRTLDAGAWSISRTTDDGKGIRTVRGVDSVLDPDSGMRVVNVAEDEVYPLADFPRTMRALEERSAFVAGVDVPGSDPAEVEMLRSLGYTALLAVATVDSNHGYLLELYADSNTSELASAAAHARVLAHYCARYHRPDSSPCGAGLDSGDAG